MAKWRGRRLLAVVLAVAAAVIGVGLAIAQDPETLRIRSNVAAEDSRAPAYLTALVGAGLTRGNAYDVQVNMVVDLIGLAKMDMGHVERLRDAGCQLVMLNPPRWYALENVNYRTHRKILVVDGRIGFVGGAGVADYWLGRAQDKDHWRETHVRLRGPIVRFLEGASMLVSSAPSVGGNSLKRLYLLSIAMARRAIDITSPYFITDRSTMWAFEDAVARGVKVRILMESDITDARPVKYASRDAFERLLSLGIELYEYLPTMMHAKVMVVDGIWSIFGSANFNNRSLELNDELNIAVMSRDLAARFTSDFEEDLRLSRRFELESWRRRPRLEKGFWSYFGEVF